MVLVAPALETAIARGALWGGEGFLGIYRIILLCLSPLVVGYLAFRLLAGRDDWAQFRSRFGRPSVVPCGDPVIWLHAASVGELKSVRAFLRYLSETYPDHEILVTTNNPTALKLASEWRDFRVTLQAAPLDFERSLRRFLGSWMPVAFVNVEGEIWPNRLAMLAARKVPVIFINARISERSLRRWKAVGFGQTMFANVARFFCQNTATADALRDVGVAPERVVTIKNMKSIVDSEIPAEELAGFHSVFAREKTILAASTHRGEDEVVLAAFATVRAGDAALKLILAPRHPDRGPEVEKLALQRGFDIAVRSKGQMPGAETAVYLADSLGDMPLMYSLAAITFVGGSLVPKGGHTPYEPAKFGSAIISGPRVANFEAEFSQLQACAGCQMIEDATELALAFQTLLSGPVREMQVANAREGLAVEADMQSLFRAMIEPLALGGKHDGGI
ncbi:MAG: 3-deoxy-D-manno-octulosonic acid transferase [Rhodobacteraceae bacterium]|nr:3-deoxy-D-manno-octulosonic acid transferase [Paracoccaceae bacterium]